jgi:hypothetical protein
MAMEGRIKYPLHKIAEASSSFNEMGCSILHLPKHTREFSTDGLELTGESAPAHLVPAACSEMSRLNEVLPPAASKLAGDGRKSILDDHKDRRLFFRPQKPLAVKGDPSKRLSVRFSSQCSQLFKTALLHPNAARWYSQHDGHVRQYGHRNRRSHDSASTR